MKSIGSISTCGKWHYQCCCWFLKDAAFIFIQSSALALMSISRSKGNWAFGNMLLFDNINKSTLFASIDLQVQEIHQHFSIVFLCSFADQELVNKSPNQYTSARYGFEDTKQIVFYIKSINTNRPPPKKMITLRLFGDP